MRPWSGHRLRARTWTATATQVSSLSLLHPCPSIPLCPPRCLRRPRLFRLRQDSPSICIGATSVAAAAAAFGRQESHPKDNERGAAEPQRRQTLPKHNPAGNALRHRKPNERAKKRQNKCRCLVRQGHRYELNSAGLWRENAGGGRAQAEDMSCGSFAVAIMGRLLASLLLRTHDATIPSAKGEPRDTEMI